MVQTCGVQKLVSTVAVVCAIVVGSSMDATVVGTFVSATVVGKSVGTIAVETFIGAAVIKFTNINTIFNKHKTNYMSLHTQYT